MKRIQTFSHSRRIIIESNSQKMFLKTWKKCAIWEIFQRTKVQITVCKRKKINKLLLQKFYIVVSVSTNTIVFHFRREKLSLGIDSLLAMSILMMMVSEQMPTSSDFVPLFGIFYLSIIFIIFIGTLFTAFILNVHLQKMYAKPVSPIVSYIFFGRVSFFNWKWEHLS